MVHYEGLGCVSSASWIREQSFRAPGPERVTGGSSPSPCCGPFGGVGAAGAFVGCGFSSERAEQVPWEGSIAQTHSPAPFSLVLHTSMEGLLLGEPLRSPGPWDLQPGTLQRARLRRSR